MVRLLIPIDFDAAYVVESKVILPKVIDILGITPKVWPLSIGNTLLAIWSVGSIVHAIRVCFAEHKAYKSRKTYPRIESGQLNIVSAKLGKPYKIVLSPKANQPYTVGIFNPVIYLPYIKYSDTELYYILLHEVQHIKSHDNLKRLIFLIIEVVFWWNPLAHIAVNEFELLTEYSCDSKVAADMDSDTLVAYLSTIISVLKRLNPDEDKTKPKLAVMFAQTYDIKQRFEVLLRRNDRKPRHIRYTVWIIMLVFFIMSYFVIIQPYYSSPTDVQSQENILSINNDDSFLLFDEGTYLLVHNGTIFEEISEDQLINPPYNKLSIIGE